MSGSTLWINLGIFGAILSAFTFIHQFMRSERVTMTVNAIVALSLLLIILLFCGVFSFGFSLVYAWIIFEIGNKKITIVRRKK